MVGIRVVFGVVVSSVFRAHIPVITKLVLGGVAAEPPEAHIHHFGSAGIDCCIGNTCSGELSVWIGLFGWGHPIEMRLCLWEIISLAMTKMAASSDLAADAITNLTIWAIERTAPLKCGKARSLTGRCVVRCSCGR
jgi:hypothetical protein